MHRSPLAGLVLAVLTATAARAELQFEGCAEPFDSVNTSYYTTTCGGTCDTGWEVASSSSCVAGTFLWWAYYDTAYTCTKSVHYPVCLSCLPGYYGLSCAACNCGEGTCHDGLSGSGVCFCPEGFSGAHCQYSDATMCNGHGSASSSGCFCDPGFTGPTCAQCAAGSTQPECLPLQIQGIYPNTAPETGGVEVEIPLSNLGSSAASVSVGGVPCAITSQTATSLRCTVAPGTGEYLDVVVEASVGRSARLPQAFSYGQPYIANLTPAHAFTQGGTTVELSGNLFGNTGLTVTLDGVAMRVTAATLTRVAAILPAGEGVDHTLALSANGMTATTKFRYDPPTVDGVLPASGPSGGGTVLVVSGTSFGTSATVTIGGQDCPVQRQSHTLLECLAPAGTGAGLPLVVTVAGQSSQPGLTWSYAPPSIEGVFPSHAPTTGGALVSIVGSSLGASAASVTVGGSTCRVVNATHTQIDCLLPPGQGTEVEVSVAAGGLEGRANLFSYDAPRLLGRFIPTAPTLGGTTLQLSGTSFGLEATVTVGGAVCPVTSQTHTSIACTLPAGAGKDNAIVVEAGGQRAGGLTLDYDPPLITAVAPVHGPTAGGTLFVVAGANFGADRARVTIGAKQCSIVSASHTSITCFTPAGQGAALPIVVDAAGQAATAAATFAYDPPSIAQLSPGSGPTQGGTELVIRGANFGTAASVEIGGVLCTPLDQSHTQIRCLTPAGAGAGKQVVVHVAGASATASDRFSYDAPVLTALTPATGSTTGGTRLVLQGSSLGAGAARVTVGGRVCDPVTRTHTLVECTLPAGEGRQQPVVLTADGQSSAPLRFDYDPPVISAVFPSVAPRSGGEVQIAGANFGLTATVTVGGADCPVTRRSHTMLACTAAPGSAKSAPLAVAVAGQVATADFGYVETAPIAHSDSVTTAEDTPVEVVLGATDAEGDAVAFTIVSQPAAAEGTVTLAGNLARFEPAPDWNGTTTFSLRANDGQLDSNTAQVQITVTPVPDAPRAVDTAAQTLEDTPVEFLLNATDVDSPALTATVVDAPDPAVGVLTVDGLVARFVPARDANGAATFTFRVSDGQLDSQVAHGTIYLAAVEDAPVAADVSAATDEDTPVTVALSATDADGEGVTFRLVTTPLPAQGTAVVQGASLVFTPARDFNGVVTFQVAANDGQLDSLPGTVLIAVRPVNDAPIAESQVLATDAGTALRIPLSATDVDGDALAFALDSTMPRRQGDVVLNGAEAVYTSPKGFEGTTSFTFHARDASSSSAPATVTIQVARVKKVKFVAPTPAATVRASAGSPLQFQVAATGATSYAITNLPQGANFDGRAGLFTWTPSRGDAGARQLTLTATDGDEVAATTITLDVR